MADPASLISSYARRVGEITSSAHSILCFDRGEFREIYTLFEEPVDPVEDAIYDAELAVRRQFPEVSVHFILEDRVTPAYVQSIAASATQVVRQDVFSARA
jgi:hypothetical protein